MKQVSDLAFLLASDLNDQAWGRRARSGCASKRLRNRIFMFRFLASHWHEVNSSRDPEGRDDGALPSNPREWYRHGHGLAGACYDLWWDEAGSLH